MVKKKLSTEKKIVSDRLKKIISVFFGMFTFQKLYKNFFNIFIFFVVRPLFTVLRPFLSVLNTQKNWQNMEHLKKIFLW